MGFASVSRENEGCRLIIQWNYQGKLNSVRPRGKGETVGVVEYRPLHRNIDYDALSLLGSFRPIQELVWGSVLISTKKIVSGFKG